jgi:hypothetical protein
VSAAARTRGTGRRSNRPVRAATGGFTGRVFVGNKQACRWTRERKGGGEAAVPIGPDREGEEASSGSGRCFRMHDSKVPLSVNPSIIPAFPLVRTEPKKESGGGCRRAAQTIFLPRPMPHETTSVWSNELLCERSTYTHACYAYAGCPLAGSGKVPQLFFFCECFINRITLYCYRSIQSNLLLLFFPVLLRGSEIG